MSRWSGLDTACCVVRYKNPNLKWVQLLGDGFASNYNRDQNTRTSNLVRSLPLTLLNFFNHPLRLSPARMPRMVTPYWRISHFQHNLCNTSYQVRSAVRLRCCERVSSIRPTIYIFAICAESATGKIDLASALAFAVHVFDGVPQKLHD